MLNLKILDEVIQVTNDEAFDDGAPALPRGRAHGRDLVAAAVAHAAYKVAARPENEGKLIVAVLASHGERYLSTPLYDFPDDTVPPPVPPGDAAAGPLL